MEFITYSHRFADLVLSEQIKFRNDFLDIKNMLSSISEQDLKKGYLEDRKKRTSAKSLSVTINSLIKEKLESKGWMSEAAIFREDEYLKNKTWRLDFTKNDISIEVGFNHGGDIAHNLMKPVIASELNHVKKDNQTELGIIICATDALKTSGGFDNAVGPMEKYISYLKPYSNYITVPVLIIGLLPPKSFRIDSDKKSPTYREIIDL